MQKTTVYLPEALRKAIKAEAARSSRSEAEVIREAIERQIADRARPQPRYGLVEGKGEPLAARADELLEGFGER